MNTPAILKAVVYGDLETVTTCRDNVIERSAHFNLDIIGWHHDPEGLRQTDDPSEAPGLVSALGKCDRTRAALYIPFPVDAPGEHRWRLIAQWLHGRDLRFFLGGAEYQWDRPFDAVDRAVRDTLDASHNLASAVVASGAVPSLDALLDELLGQSTFDGDDDAARTRRDREPGLSRSRSFRRRLRTARQSSPCVPTSSY
jgi:hypothetical protein